MTAEPQRTDRVDTTSVTGLEHVFVDVLDQEVIDTGSSGDEGMKLSEASDKYGVTERTIQRWIKEGKLLAHKIEGQHGPEWRIIGEAADDSPGYQGMTAGRNAVDMTMDSFDGFTGLLEKLTDQLQETNDRLQSANYRIGYLENEKQNYQEQLKLLPDLQAQAERAKALADELARSQEEATRLDELERELEQTKRKDHVIEELNKTVEEQAQRLAAFEEKAKSRKGFWKWFTGQS